jgi:hypothetical protein
LAGGRAEGSACRRISARPGNELAHGKGLDKIVVSPKLEPVDLVLFFASGGNNQHRHIAPDTDLAQDRKSV